MANASPKTPALCSDSQTNCGTAVINPAKAAPAPRATMTAGNTQQIKVPPLANKVRKLIPTFRRSGAFASDSSFMVSHALANIVERRVGAANGDHRVARVRDGLA